MCLKPRANYSSWICLRSQKENIIPTKGLKSKKNIFLSNTWSALPGLQTNSPNELQTNSASPPSGVSSAHPKDAKRPSEQHRQRLRPANAPRQQGSRRRSVLGHRGHRENEEKKNDETFISKTTWQLDTFFFLKKNNRGIII